ncbi:MULTISPECIES: helix-turn-helix domain-containing protein [unclassified Bradyrhizobium]|uniref:helix-turn-helix domain-containing protein n=1 Tax=unclassified Bradyrhizobium TaxID=2631580 RepID=UPI0013E18771|nr:helix-turn-helix domain-containing protein [Bradyrhizobium sp. 6(2017)]QIG92158.1 helix-turn-helix domain-containing protein [Bradyrhizobium sp. 6(2017)]
MATPNDKASQRDTIEHLLTKNAVVRPDDLVATGAFGARNSVYDACRAGEITCFRQGKMILIPTAPLRKLLGIEEVA